MSELDNCKSEPIKRSATHIVYQSNCNWKKEQDKSNTITTDAQVYFRVALKKWWHKPWPMFGSSNILIKVNFQTPTDNKTELSSP